jgi:hypothetical protein
MQTLILTLDKTGFYDKKEVLLTGYLTINNQNNVIFIDEGDYLSSEIEIYIEINIKDFAYALISQLLLNGGGAMIFHAAKIYGYAQFDPKKMKYSISPISIFAKNNRDDDWINVDFSEEKILKGKKEHPFLFESDFFNL